MLPVVAGPAATRRQILIYSLLLLPVGASPWLLGYAGLAYGLTSLVAGTLMVVFAWRVWTSTEGQKATSAARQLFAYSILYLFVLFAVLLIESVAGRLAG
jgi:protoheme IX farnesyltransferase